MNKYLKISILMVVVVSYLVVGRDTKTTKPLKPERDTVFYNVDSTKIAQIWNKSQGSGR